MRSTSYTTPTVGCQYACREYVGMLRKHGIRVSMTESGDPKDNAQAERINNTMKNELLKGKVFRNINEVVAAVARAVDFYNNRRPHMSIGMKTPSEASGAAGDEGYDVDKLQAYGNKIQK